MLYLETEELVRRKLIHASGEAAQFYRSLQSEVVKADVKQNISPGLALGGKRAKKKSRRDSKEFCSNATSIQILKYSCGAHTAADAHRYHSVASVAAFELADDRRGEFCSGAS